MPKKGQSCTVNGAAYVSERVAAKVLEISDGKGIKREQVRQKMDKPRHSDCERL